MSINDLWELTITIRMHLLNIHVRSCTGQMWKAISMVINRRMTSGDILFGFVVKLLHVLVIGVSANDLI